MKSVLISIQPYWVFLIIAKKMGWNIGKEKTVEVRKNYPKDENWNKVAKIYCSKDKKSFAKIPKEYQPLMERFIGKVIGEFVCNNIDWHGLSNLVVKEDAEHTLDGTCLTKEEVLNYLGYQKGTSIYACKNYEFYGWYISDLVIYDKPRELSEFKIVGCKGCRDKDTYHCKFYCTGERRFKRPPQSWAYCESEVDTE